MSVRVPDFNNKTSRLKIHRSNIVLGKFRMKEKSLKLNFFNEHDINNVIIHFPINYISIYFAHFVAYRNRKSFIRNFNNILFFNVCAVGNSCIWNSCVCKSEG